MDGQSILGVSLMGRSSHENLRGKQLIRYSVKIAICMPSACLFRCKDSHLVQMQHDPTAYLHNFEDSTTMLFPIQGLISNSKRFDQVKDGLKSNCKLNMDYKICLSECASSNEGRLLLAGLKPWLFICDSNNERKVELFLRCFWRNSDKMEKMCNRQMKNINYALQDLMNLKTWKSYKFQQLCQFLNEHDSCYSRSVQKYCGPQESNFVQDLSEINNASLLEIFRFDPTLAQKLPAECINRRREITIRKNITVTTMMTVVKNFVESRNGQKIVHDYDYIDFRSGSSGRNSGCVIVISAVMFLIMSFFTVLIFFIE